jgi:hypothetical protein
VSKSLKALVRQSASRKDLIKNCQYKYCVKCKKVQVEVDRIRSEVPNDKLKSSTQVRSEVE